MRRRHSHFGAACGDWTLCHQSIQSPACIVGSRGLHVCLWQRWARYECTYDESGGTPQCKLQHHREGKTDAITGRFFEPRLPEEFYDNHTDFDNARNLIDAPEHQAMISELRAALREKQLELRDSGLLPEKMRERRAAANNLTIYDMVRDDNLYPLAAYLDAADLALERDKKNLATLERRMSHKDEGMRWWAAVGLRLLDEDARGATAVLKRALEDESHEVRMMSAWSLIELGQRKQAFETLEKLVFEGTTNEPMLHNVVDWIGEPAFPLVKKYLENGGSRDGRYGISIFARIEEVEGL